MNKKTYIIPELETVEIELSKVLCASDGTGSSVELPEEKSTEEPLY
jgi:hypothetical protein